MYSKRAKFLICPRLYIEVMPTSYLGINRCILLLAEEHCQHKSFQLLHIPPYETPLEHQHIFLTSQNSMQKGSPDQSYDLP